MPNSPKAGRQKPEHNDDSDLSLEQALTAALNHSVVVDIETTGLQAEEDRIVELALLAVDGGEVVKTFTSLFNPQLPIPQAARNIHGIGDEDVSESPTFAELASDVARLIRGRIIVGHNVRFDLAFIDAELQRSGVGEGSAGEQNATEPPVATLCTAKAARELIPRDNIGRYSLANLAEYFQSTARPVHRAESDARTTLELLKHLRELVR